MQPTTTTIDTQHDHRRTWHRSAARERVGGRQTSETPARRVGFLASAAAAVMLTLAAPSAAGAAARGSVWRDYYTVKYLADPGTRNEIEVREFMYSGLAPSPVVPVWGVYEGSPSGLPLWGGDGCSIGRTRNRVLCRKRGTPAADAHGHGDNLVLRLGDLDDRAEVHIESQTPVTVIGGPGVDVIQTGPGNDTINARDGERDTVNCGPGTDQVIADPAEASLAGCENVLRPDVPDERGGY